MFETPVLPDAKLGFLDSLKQAKNRLLFVMQFGMIAVTQMRQGTATNGGRFLPRTYGGR